MKIKKHLSFVLFITLLCTCVACSDTQDTTSHVSQNQLIVEEDDYSLNEISEPENTSTPSFNKEDVLTQTIAEIHPSNLCTYGSVKITINDEKQMPTSIHPSDIINITIPAHELIDFNKINIIGVHRENMKDPYLIDASNLPPCIFNVVPIQADELLMAQATIGYDTKSGDILDVLFLYDGIVTWHTTFYIDNSFRNDELWLQQQYPDATVYAFNIVMDEVSTRVYSLNPQQTLIDWVQDKRLRNEWNFNGTNIIDVRSKWVMPPDIIKLPLSEITEVVCIPYEEMEEPKEFEYDDENSKYAITLLGTTRAEVISRMGQPNNAKENETYTELTYPEAKFYLENDKVVQIDILAATFLPINDFPTTPINEFELLAFCREKNIKFPDLTTRDSENFYRSMHEFKHKDWTICYTWEGINPVAPNKEPFTRLILYVGEFYKY